MESFRTVVDARAMGSLSRIGQWMGAVAHQFWVVQRIGVEYE